MLLTSLGHGSVGPDPPLAFPPTEGPPPALPAPLPPAALPPVLGPLPVPSPPLPPEPLSPQASASTKHKHGASESAVFILPPEGELRTQGNTYPEMVAI